MLFIIFCILGFALSTQAEVIGSCPPTLPVNQCEAACGPQAECVPPQLCCPTSCGGSMCVDPVTQRRFTNLVKPGHCPDTPGGVWVCTDTCTTDSDCPRKLKCCRNRCKALTCMRADVNAIGRLRDTSSPDDECKVAVEISTKV